MWEILSNDEQTAVITDLRQFIAMSLRGDIDGVVGDFQNALLNNDNGNDNDNHKNDRINDIWFKIIVFISRLNQTNNNILIKYTKNILTYD